LPIVGFLRDGFESISLVINIVVVLLASLSIGLALEKLIRSRLLKAYAKSRIEYYKVIGDSFRGMITLWSLLIALDYIVSTLLHLPPLKTSLLEKLIFIAGLLSATLFSVNITVGIVEVYARKYRGAFPAASILKNVVKATVLTIGLLILLDALGISITPLVTALGIGGLAVALAIQDSLSNFFAGLHIVASGEVKIGDYVRLESGEEGMITDINWRTTTIKTILDTLIVIPNSKLASSMLVNYHRPARPYLVAVQVGVSYKSDLDKVEKVTIEVAKEVLREVPGGDPYFEPYLRYTGFGESSVNFKVYLRVQGYPLHIPVIHEFVKRLHKRYTEEGIEIPYPTRTVYIREEHSPE